jgi:hypothetical protein
MLITGKKHKYHKKKTWKLRLCPIGGCAKNKSGGKWVKFMSCHQIEDNKVV